MYSAVTSVNRHFTASLWSQISYSAAGRIQSCRGRRAAAAEGIARSSTGLCAVPAGLGAVPCAALGEGVRCGSRCGCGGCPQVRQGRAAPCRPQPGTARPLSPGRKA